MNRVDYFHSNIIWNANLAYVVGLLVTDGNLSKDGRHIIMRSSDLDLLKTFSNCLFLQNKIAVSINNGYAKKPCYRIQFGNVRLYRWLLEIGLFPAKTYTIGEIKVPDEYFRDFLRGHLDGDGTILTYRDEYNSYFGRMYFNQRVYTKFISASQKHIYWLNKKINQLAAIKGSLTCTTSYRKHRVPIWLIKFAKAESVTLLNWLYYKSDLPCLQRKMLLAQNILHIVHSQKRKKYEKLINS